MTITRKINTLIVDDEPLARRNLLALLKGQPDIEIAGECGNGAEAIRAIETRSPDLLFLDIQMPKMDGFEVLGKIGLDRIPAIVFVTAYDQYALRAFEVQALDYLLKPFDDERFEATLWRVRAQIEQSQSNELNKKLLALLEADDRSRLPIVVQPDYLSKLLIKSAGRIFYLNVTEIDWIEAADYYVRFHVGAKSYMYRETMTELEKQLDPNKFRRIHRSAIINLDRLKEVSVAPTGEYFVVLANGARLKLSRSRRDQALSLLTHLTLT